MRHNAMVVTQSMRVHCHAKSRDGDQCRKYAIPGGTVCRYHGGRSPAVQASAAQRLAALVHPAISALSELIQKADSDATRMSAARYALEVNGWKPSVQLETESEITIRVIDEVQPSTYLAPAASNGVHSN